MSSENVLLLPMPDSASNPRPLRIASVIPSLTAGGVGSVCRYAAEGLACKTGWSVTLLCLHDSPSVSRDEGNGFRIVGLGLHGNCPREFLRWLHAHPQDLVITSDVCRIEPAFRFLPPGTRHVIQIHDSGRRYRDVAVRHAASVDGVTCVGRHIESRLQCRLNAVKFRGLLRTVHNGACFPPLKSRPPYTGPLRLLFVGRVDALKGVFDVVPLLQRLRILGVPVTLNLVGGDNEALRRRLQRKGLADRVNWTGCVPHELCYTIAAESDVFLMLSRKEPFGMVTVEAMSMGCVPIAYDTPSGSTEIIEHGKSGLLMPLGDLGSWAAEIKALHFDRSSLAVLSSGAIHRARTDFSSEVMCDNLSAFLRDVVDHAERQPSLRDAGLPPEESNSTTIPARGYQLLPAWLRTGIRNWVCSRPRLSYWILNR